MNNNIYQSRMLRVGKVLHDTYRIGSYLASGGFGNTYVATNIQFDEIVAIKEFYIKGISNRDNNNTQIGISVSENQKEFEGQLAKFKKEAKRLRKLHNEHIVAVHDLFEENGTAYYVMDYINGRSLQEVLKDTDAPLSESQVWDIIQQVLDALQCVHEAGLLHLDIKPANLMIDQTGRVRLIDFGASKQKTVKDGVTTTTTFYYTPGYAPVEQVEGNMDKIGRWTDFYALGATIYTLLVNKRPPAYSDIMDDESPTKENTLEMTHVKDPNLRKLVLWLMKGNSKRRPQTVEEILQSGLIPTASEGTKNQNASSQKVNDPHKEEQTKLKEGHTTGDDNSIKKKKPNTSGSQTDEYNITLPIPPRPNHTLRNILIGAFIGIVLFVGAIASCKSCGGTNDMAAADSTATDSTANTVTKMHCTIALGECDYSGDINADSIPNGVGEAWFKDGRYYKGRFVNGSLDDSEALFYYGNGDCYKGSFHNNHFQYGVYTVKESGEYFKGSFNNEGQPTEGTWYNKNGRQVETLNKAATTTTTQKPEVSQKKKANNDYYDYAADSVAVW